LAIEEGRQKLDFWLYLDCKGVLARDPAGEQHGWAENTANLFLNRILLVDLSWKAYQKIIGIHLKVKNGICT
jgi:hypothetical protein